MAAIRTMAAAFAAVGLVGYVQATEVSLPPCLDPFQPFVYSGCFRDLDRPKILPYRSPTPSDDMTVDKCVAECKGNGYRYAGLVYYGVCYCGQTVNGPQVDESECSFPCNGDNSQTCGGDNTFNIYTDPTFPIEDVTVEDYDSLGCWTDDSAYGRALTYRQDQLDSATLTTEKCLAACRDGGFPFAGTQYGGECYCGVVIGNGTFSADNSQCDMPCNGDSSQTCGGRSRLNLFVADELQSLQPCGYEPPEESSSSSSALPSSTPPAESSSSVPPVESSSSVPPVQSSSSIVSSSSVVPSSTSSVASSSSVTSSSSSITSPPVSSTRSSSVSSTRTSSSVCVTTTVVPPTCEYKCGRWCPAPLPDFNDVKSCKAAWSQCQLQVASCFHYAGWPDVLECFNFGQWCGDIVKYCDSKPSGGCKKWDFWNKKPGKPNTPPKTTTVTVPCAPAATSSSVKPSSTTQAPVPTPTNICIQPTNNKYGYGPNKPVGNIALPVVTCNDLSQDWPGYPFKKYSEVRSSQCKKYKRDSCASACVDACKDQYEDCVDVYAQGCRGRRRARGEEGENYFEFAQGLEKRTWGFPGFPSWSDSYNGAIDKCKAQYNDCKAVNQKLTCSGKCPRFGQF